MFPRAYRALAKSLRLQYALKGMKPRIAVRGGAKALAQRHPWVFSGGVTLPSGQTIENGSIVEVVDADDQSRLGRGFYSAQSNITCRMLTFDADEPIDDAFFRRRLEAARDRRRDLERHPGHTAFRLVYGESDGLPGCQVGIRCGLVSMCLPGLIVDKYDNWLSAQFIVPGMHSRRHELARLMMGLWLYASRGPCLRGPLSQRYSAHAGCLSGPIRFVQVYGAIAWLICSCHEFRNWRWRKA